jgi:toxin YhaV
VNDENTLRSSGSKNDPYVMFQKMLKSGNPPNDWDGLREASRTNWQED